MGTAIGIILADVLLFVLYVCQYRQELGLSVNGSHDLPVARKRPVKRPSPPPVAVGGGAALSVNRSRLWNCLIAQAVESSGQRTTVPGANRPSTGR